MTRSILDRVSSNDLSESFDKPSECVRGVNESCSECECLRLDAEGSGSESDELSMDIAAITKDIRHLRSSVRRTAVGKK